MPAQRVIQIRPRTIALVVAIVLAFALALQIVLIAGQVIVWIFIALFLALAINPLVDWLQARGVRRRGPAVAIAFGAVLIAAVGVAAVFVPILVDQIGKFIDAVPGYVKDLTEGRGRLGFLESDYHVVEKVEKAIKDNSASKVLGASNLALSLTKGVISAIAAAVTITFMTLFMLLEGPSWVDRFFSLFSEKNEQRWRAVGRDVYRTVGGYVAGNVLISLIAGTLATIVLWVLGVPYPVPLGLLVALLDLVPLAGATVAAVIVTGIAFTTGVWTGVIVLVYFVIYQQVENQLLQPVIYGKTVQLSPLAVLIAVLIGAKLGGIVGALAAIPVAGAIQIILRDLLQNRASAKAATASPGKKKAVLAQPDG
ncbi:MAG: AI-2E family transporter [Gaiellaceae bacterium]